MTDFRLTLEAKEDLIQIWSFTDEKWGTAQADHYVEGLEYCFAELDELPSHGCRELVPDTQSDVRFYRYQSHYVFFRKVPGGGTSPTDSRNSASASTAGEGIGGLERPDEEPLVFAMPPPVRDT